MSVVDLCPTNGWLHGGTLVVFHLGAPDPGREGVGGSDRSRESNLRIRCLTGDRGIDTGVEWSVDRKL